MAQNTGRPSRATNGREVLSLQPRGYEVPCLDQVSNILNIQYMFSSSLPGEGNKSSKSDLAGRVA